MTSTVFITHGIQPSVFNLSIESWFYWLGKRRDITKIEIHKDPSGTYQAYAFGRCGNVITAQHDQLAGERPEAGRGYRGNGITYEELLTIVGKSNKRLTKKQVKLIGQYFPEFLKDHPWQD